MKKSEETIGGVPCIPNNSYVLSRVIILEIKKLKGAQGIKVAKSKAKSEKKEKDFSKVSQISCRAHKLLGLRKCKETVSTLRQGA